jgi:hypothetical protein
MTKKLKHNFTEVSECGKLYDICGMPRKYFRNCYFCDTDERKTKLYDVKGDCVCNSCIEKEVGNHISREEADE